MLAYAWKSLGWFLAGVAVALGFLLVPLQVAAERKKLDKTVSEIAAAKRDIRALETEFDTRASLAQLEQWNGDTLRLTAPVAAQYVTDEAALASIDLRAPQAGQPGVQMASLVVPSQPTGLANVQVPAPAVHLMPAVTPSFPPAPSAPVAAPTPQATHSEPVGMRFAALEKVKSVVAPVRHAGMQQAVAMLDRKLLSDSTIGDLMSSARAEAGGSAR